MRGDREFDVQVSDTTEITRLRKQGYRPYKKEGPYSFFKVPVNKHTIRRAGPKAKRKLSDETRAKLALNAAKARAARKARKR
jgi:hypothetical protein